MNDLDREFERLLRDPLTRRRLMKRGAAGALGLSAFAYLAACGPKTGGTLEQYKHPCLISDPDFRQSIGVEEERLPVVG